MGGMNLMGILGILFLGFGVVDGYRKGLVNKGICLGISLLSLFLVYIASPYVAEFLKSILPSLFQLEDILSTDSDLYRLLILSGQGDEAESYLYLIAARVLSLLITYLLVRLLLGSFLVSLRMLTKVPGLGLLNRLAGAFFGLVQQLFLLWLFFLVVAVCSNTSWGAVCCAQIQACSYLAALYRSNYLLMLLLVLFLMA